MIKPIDPSSDLGVFWANTWYFCQDRSKLSIFYRLKDEIFDMAAFFESNVILLTEETGEQDLQC